MLWHKALAETRWRFLAGLIILSCNVIVIVMFWPRVQAMLPAETANVDLSGAFGQQLQEALELSRDYRGYIWSQLFDNNLLKMAVLFAALLGSGNLLSPKPGELFTLSLPVKRSRLVLVRALTALGQLLVLAVLPSLLISLLSPSVLKSYSVTDGVTHGFSLFFGAAVVLAAAMFFSSLADDLRKPLLLTLGAAVGLYFAEEAGHFTGLFHVMSGKLYFESGQIAWIPLAAAATAAAVFLFGATVNASRRDY